MCGLRIPVRAVELLGECPGRQLAGGDPHRQTVERSPHIGWRSRGQAADEPGEPGEVVGDGCRVGGAGISQTAQHRPSIRRHDDVLGDERPVGGAEVVEVSDGCADDGKAFGDGRGAGGGLTLPRVGARVSHI